MAIALAVSAAAVWGVADFLAGLASRRLAVPLVLLLVQVGGWVVIVTVTVAGGKPFFADAGDAAQAMAAGVSGVLGLGCFYRALAIGTMSVVAPISAAGVALPLFVGLARGEHPGTVQAVGLAAIVAGVILASQERHETAAAAEAGRTSIMYALLSAVGFGGFFVLIRDPSHASVPWTLVLSRGAPIPAIALIVWRLRPVLPPPRLGLGLLVVGTIDLCATGLISLANTKGSLSVVSVLGAMYPVVTVLLAAAVLHERLRLPQTVGVALALGGVGMVAGG
jgi:drug/metabolite transporter (DMT)-like permease